MRAPLKSALAASVALFLGAAPVFAQDWSVAAVSGNAWLVAPDASGSHLAVGQIIPLGWTVATMGNSRALLVREAESMAVGPNTRMVVLSQGEYTLIVQQEGDIEFTVSPRQEGTFSVETPVLAAVVKGTVFTVSVDNEGAAIEVDRGAVEVTAIEIGEVATLGVGQQASISEEVPVLQVAGEGALPVIERVAPRPSIVPTTVENAVINAAADLTPRVVTPEEHHFQADQGVSIPGAGNQGNGGPRGGGPGGGPGGGGPGGGGPGGGPGPR